MPETLWVTKIIIDKINFIFSNIFMIFFILNFSLYERTNRSGFITKSQKDWGEKCEKVGCFSEKRVFCDSEKLFFSIVILFFQLYL